MVRVFRTLVYAGIVAAAYYAGKVKNTPTIEECVRVVQDAAPFTAQTTQTQGTAQDVGRVASLQEVECSYSVTPQGQFPTLYDKSTGTRYDVRLHEGNGSRSLGVEVMSSSPHSALTAPQSPYATAVQATSHVAARTLEGAVQGYKAGQQDVRGFMKTGGQ